MRLTISTVGQIEEDDISQDAMDALRHAFRDWVGESPPGTDGGGITDLR
jgi:hypothetical protein